MTGSSEYLEYQKLKWSSTLEHEKQKWMSTSEYLVR